MKLKLTPLGELVRDLALAALLLIGAASPIVLDGLVFGGGW